MLNRGGKVASRFSGHNNVDKRAERSTFEAIPGGGSRGAGTLTREGNLGRITLYKKERMENVMDTEIIVLIHRPPGFALLPRRAVGNTNRDRTSPGDSDRL